MKPFVSFVKTMTVAFSTLYVRMWRASLVSTLTIILKEG